MSEKTNEDAQMTPEQLAEYERLREQNTEQIKKELPHIQAEAEYWEAMAKIEESKTRYALAIRKQAELRFSGQSQNGEQPKEFSHPTANETPFGEKPKAKKRNLKKQ